MKQIRPGVFVDDPSDWNLELKIGIDLPLPSVVVINGQRYERKLSGKNNQHSGT